MEETNGQDIVSLYFKCCEYCGIELDPERGHTAPVCDDECLHFLNNEGE